MGRHSSQVFAFNNPSNTIGICVPVTRCYLCVCIFAYLYLYISLVFEFENGVIGVCVPVTRGYLCGYIAV